MILENAVLEVVPGSESEFESAFGRAKEIISSAEGFISLRLGRCAERDGRYLLLVEWQTLEAHMKGFRESAPYQEWRRLLHHFYEPFPTVEHYTVIDSV